MRELATDLWFLNKDKKVFVRKTVPVSQAQDIFTRASELTEEGQRVEVNLDGGKFKADDVLADLELDPENTTVSQN